jgi:hypothetical protein
MRFRLQYAISIALIGIAASLFLAGIIACDSDAKLEPKTRPSRVPGDAVWVGGADGGAYVRCAVDVIRKVNPCSVWNDYTGDLVESGNYRLQMQGRAATESELRIRFPDFDGSIYLEGGLVLKLQKSSSK